MKNNFSVVTQKENNLINQLGDSSLQSGDVPVVALLEYDSNIIGAGYNTVIRNRKFGEHAEINAITDAISKIGIDSFDHLDRDKLVLISSWEPCYMCEGAIVQAHIKNVKFIMSKSVLHWLKYYKWKLLYKWDRQKTGDDSIQMNLFRKHPSFEQNKDNL